MFTLGDAASAARLVNISTNPKNIWPRAWSGTDDKTLVSFASAAAKAAFGIGHKRHCAVAHVRRSRSNERLDIVGIGGERAIVKAARSPDIDRGEALIEPSQSLRIEVHRVGVRSVCSARRASTAALLNCASSVLASRRDDFVLHVEEIGQRLVKPLGP